MHIEFIVEDSSGATLLDLLIPKIIGEYGEPHSWRIHAYKGIGRIPKNMRGGNAQHRILLDQLPRLLRGYSKTAGIDAVVVVLDSDRRDCRDLLQELLVLAAECSPQLNVLFRLAIEEIEAWYLGDTTALKTSYPKAKQSVIDSYVQDSICGTWEVVAEAVYKGGVNAVNKIGWPLPGELKHEWAKNIGPYMSIDNNNSVSFCKFRDGLRRITAPNFA